MVKWGGAAVTVLLVGVWIASGWCHMTFNTSQWGVSVGRGLLFVYTNAYPADPFPRGVFVVSNDSDWGVNLWFVPPLGPRRIPLWFAIVGLLVATAIAWRLDTLARRRAKLNLCPKCNYDRAGLAAAAVCPECGRSPSHIPSSSA
jgi:hypothetical protein